MWAQDKKKRWKVTGWMVRLEMLAPDPAAGAGQRHPHFKKFVQIQLRGIQILLN
jgi:hypothetical protein